MDFTYLGAGLAIGLSAIGVAIGQGMLTLKAMEIMGKNPGMSNFYLTTTILGVALVESAAIYGLIIALKILNMPGLDPTAAIGIGLCVGLAGLGVGIGEGKMVSGALVAMNRNPENKQKILSFMVLFLALIESAAIYGLVIAFHMLSIENLNGFAAIGAGCAVGFAGLGVGIGEGLMAEKALLTIAEKPRLTSFYLTVAILGIALVETAAIYGMLIGFNILGATVSDPLVLIGAGLAIGLAGLGVGVGEGKMAAEAMEAVGMNNEYRKKIITFMILFVALIESAAIYGLIIATQIINSESITGLVAIGAGLAIGLAGLGVGIGEGTLAAKAMDVAGKEPKLHSFILTTTILGIALVESAAIYGLVISIQIMGPGAITGVAAIGAGLAIGFAGLGAGVGEGNLVGGALGSIHRNPANKNKSMAFMILFLALIEVLPIYGLIIAFQILG